MCGGGRVQWGGPGVEILRDMKEKDEDGGMRRG